MSQPDSPTSTFEEVLQNPVGLPDYQRDFAWNSDKMTQLWEDLKLHLFTKSQLNAKKMKNGYYLGAVVVDETGNKPRASTVNRDLPP